MENQDNIYITGELRKMKSNYEKKLSINLKHLANKLKKNDQTFFGESTKHD